MENRGPGKYCGNKRLAVHVPQEAKTLKTVHIVSLEESSKIKVKMMLCNIIEDPEAHKWQIGVIGEITLREKYKDSILAKFAEAYKISPDSLRLEPSGEGYGRPGFPDIYVITNKEIVIEGKTIPKETKIAIVEVGSTTLADNVGQFREQIERAIADLKDHIGENLNAYAGIAASLAYDPVHLLLSDVYPEFVGNYRNPFIVIFKRSDIMEKSVDELVAMIIRGD
ncbi:MAG: hypothetical protein FGF52_00975 [Candidatus Brockarchaeota archaeon]|nr:hypothetical protein [Candidatus Brockarchaeota archaeon]